MMIKALMIPIMRKAKIVFILKTVRLKMILIITMLTITMMMMIIVMAMMTG